MMTQLGHSCPKCDEILKRAKEQENKAVLLVCKESVEKSFISEENKSKQDGTDKEKESSA
tara:strand:- start:88 stop:267 length:180 start_codon:yes stop_codon:yes gene_type:complete